MMITKKLTRELIFISLVWLPTSVLALTFQGVLHAKNKNLNGLQGHGIAWVFDSTVKGNIEIRGVLVTNNTDVTGNIILKGDYLEMIDTMVTDISIINPTFNKKRIKVFISDQSKIKGNVTFLGKKGEVEIDSTSTIMGSVKNGKIIKAKGKAIKK